jgi:hypothetical protein
MKNIYRIRLKESLLHKTLYRKTTIYTWALLFFCTIIIYFVLFFPCPIGASDNADFERYAAAVGINGIQSLSDDTYPYFYKLYYQWQWLPFSVDILSPFYPKLSNVYPISFIRLVTNILGNTADNPYILWYLSLVCVPLILAAAYQLFRFVFYTIGLSGLWIAVLGMFILLGSVHLCWLHSFYSEAMIFIWLLVTLGSACSTIMSKKGSKLGKVMSVLTLISMHMFVTANSQTVTVYPFWFIAILIFLLFHWTSKGYNEVRIRKWIRRIMLYFLIVCLLLSGVACVKLYQWNNGVNDRVTLYNSLFTGLLPIVNDPEATLEELGLNPILAQNSGKYGFSSDLIAPPLSRLAETMVFSRINIFGILKYYIQHPSYLYKAMEISSQNARQYDTFLFLQPYTDENGETQYEQHIAKFAFWEKIRPYIVPGNFILYVLIYISLFTCCIITLFRSSKNVKKQMMIVLYIVLMFTGLVQFPMAFLVNGLTNPITQMYLFMLSYDLTILVGIGWAFTALRNYCNFKAKCHQLSRQIQSLQSRWTGMDE